MTIDTGYKPREFQQEIHRGLKRFSVLVCHRRFGKTVLSINALIDAALRCKLDRPRYGYVAPLYSQAKSIAWDYLKHYTKEIPGVKRNESELWIELPTGARIRLFGADNPDALRGMYFDGVVLDEVAQMRPEVWGEIIRPALSDRKGWALFIGTPKGMNLFSELYYLACKEDEWFAGFYPASRTGIVQAEELEAARNQMSDNQYRQEFECDFSASVEDRLITLDLVLSAAGKVYPEPAYYHAPVILSVDVARFGDDKSVLITRQGIIAHGLKKFRSIDTMYLADMVMKEHAEKNPDAVFVDEVGIGAGVIDALRRQGFRVTGVNGGATPGDENKYANKRAEMWVSMRDWLIAGGSIPDDAELKSDLTAPIYTYDNRSRYVLEKKSEMKKRGLSSPDCGDALAMTFAYPVHKKSELEKAAAKFPKKPYDPLKWQPGGRR